MERSGEAKSCSLGALQQTPARGRGGAANRGGRGVGEAGGPPVVAGAWGARGMGGPPVVAGVGWVPHAGRSGGRGG